MSQAPPYFISMFVLSDSLLSRTLALITLSFLYVEYLRRWLCPDKESRFQDEKGNDKKLYYYKISLMRQRLLDTDAESVTNMGYKLLLSDMLFLQ
jgi:hypothetical protein